MGTSIEGHVTSRDPPKYPPSRSNRIESNRINRSSTAHVVARETTRGDDDDGDDDDDADDGDADARAGEDAAGEGDATDATDDDSRAATTTTTGKAAATTTGRRRRRAMWRLARRAGRWSWFARRRWTTTSWSCRVITASAGARLGSRWRRDRCFISGRSLSCTAFSVGSSRSKRRGEVSFHSRRARGRVHRTGAGTHSAVGADVESSGDNKLQGGGANSWKYDSITNWEFCGLIPVLVYFKETQTKSDGQPHFFPIIMDGKMLYGSCCNARRARTTSRLRARGAWIWRSSKRASVDKLRKTYPRSN